MNPVIESIKNRKSERKFEEIEIPSEAKDIILDAAFQAPTAGNQMLYAIIAAQNAVVAAESLGLGSCYIGDILENVEIHQELLGLDPFTVPISMLVFGYPTEG